MLALISILFYPLKVSALSFESAAITKDKVPALATEERLNTAVPKAVIPNLLIGKTNFTSKI
jgi:hypothetical protein